MTEPAPYIDYANLPSPDEGLLMTLFITVRRVARAAADIAAAAGVPYSFDRRQEAPVEAMLAVAGIQDAADPGSPPVIVTGRSHHVPHQVIGSVPVRLMHQSPYPVLTIT